MAKTYYGYKKREGLKPIDYLGATKDLTEGLTGIFEEREKERGLIEEEIREAEKQTKDVPMGDSSTLNEAVLDSSSGAAEALRAQTQLMRNGIIKPSEFTKFKQNVMDGMVDLKEGAVSLNKHITETSAAVEAGTASVAQAKFLEDAMQDTWFDRTRMYTDPKSGHMMIVRTDEKGKDIKGSENSVRNFKNQTKQIIARYDIEKETSSFTKTLGEDIRLSMKSGVKTVKDALSKKTIDPVTKKEYTGFDLVNKYVDGASDADLASILVDELSGNYSPTGDVNDKGKAGMVYYEADPTAVNKNSRVPKLTKDQRDSAREYLRANIYAQIDYVETPAATTKTSDSDIKAREDKRNAENTMNRMRDFFEGSTSEREEVLTTYIKETQGIIPKGGTFNKVEVIGDKLFIRYTDKERNPTEFPKGGIVIPDNLEDFVKTIGPVLTGNKDLHSLLKGSGLDFTSEKGKGTGDAAFEVGTEEYKGQNIIGYEEVIANVSDVLDTFYLNEGKRTTHAKQMANDFISKTGMKDVTVTEKNKVMTISTGDLGSITVDLKPSDSEQVKENLTVALKKLHDAVSQGKNLGDGTPDPNPDPNPNPANPFD